MIQKHKEIIYYLIFGLLTTLVSLATYYLLTLTILNPNNPFELQIANIISWIVAVTFAYFTNRKYVFDSKNPSIIIEAIKFYSARLASLFLDMILMYILVTKMQYDDRIIKLVVQIIIIVANYILSKFIVFKNKKITD